MDFIMEIERANKIMKTILTEQELGVTYSELLALVSIKKGYKTLKSISDHILINKSHVHRMLNRLIEEKFISKEGVGRYINFSMTRRGKLLLEDAMKTVKYVASEDLKGETQDSILNLRNTLVECNEKLAMIYLKS